MSGREYHRFSGGTGRGSPYRIHQAQEIGRRRLRILRMCKSRQTRAMIAYRMDLPPFGAIRLDIRALRDSGLVQPANPRDGGGFIITDLGRQFLEESTHAAAS